MEKNIVEKIIDRHLIEENEHEIGIRIDQTLTQDATGTMVYLELETIGIDKIKTDLSVSYVDHNTLQCGYENADDHLYLRTIADKFGIIYSRPGNGICHQVHLERFSSSYKTLLGSDSHTPTCGGVGCLSIGAGGIDVAAAMAGEPFYMPRPKIMLIELTGRLPPICEAKDIILYILSKLTTKGNVGFIIEYGGDGVKTLSVPERATICNMGAELGVTTSIFPSDEVTEQFFEAQDRDKDFRKLTADNGAKYDKTLKIDLESIVPMVAKPHSPDNVVAVNDVVGTPVQQICIGSCTNSSLYDLTVANSMLKGSKVPADTDLVIAPGSRQVLLTAEKMGIISSLIECGARIMEPTCGFCIGNGQSPQTNSNSLRTNNRNFFGRSGTTSAGVFISGVRVAAASALKGKITMPKAIDEEDKEILGSKMLVGLKNDDSMFIRPTGRVDVIKGPNIGQPPKGMPIEDTISGVATIKVADKITTDDIMPAGSRLKYRSNIAKYAKFVFENIDDTFHSRAAALRDEGKANFIIAGASYGQGSSREHAAICPAYLGVKCVIFKSIERIHRANLINFGILPLTFVDKRDYEIIEEGDELELHQVHRDIKDSQFTLFNITKNKKIHLESIFSDREKKYLYAGGKLHAIGGRKQ
ncbi:MAG: aconitate hydratase [Candidatus Methanofastidiosia archaeon]